MRCEFERCQIHICMEPAGQPNVESNNVAHFLHSFYIGVANLVTGPPVGWTTRKTPTPPDGLAVSDCQYP